MPTWLLIKWRSIGIKHSTENKPQTKTSLPEKEIPNFYVEKTIIQRANSATFRLLMFFMVSSFKGKFKNQT